MSNDQWNNDHGDSAWRPSSAEWDQSQHPQPPQEQSGGPWTASHGQNVGTPSQPSAGEWTSGAQQASAPPRHVGGQPGNPQAPAGWEQQSSGWHQNAQGGFAPGQQYQQRPSQEPTGMRNVLELSFTRFVLPNGAGVIFMIAVVGFLLRWLLNLVWTLSYGPDATNLIEAVFGELAIALIYILLTRAFLEGMSALVRLSHRDGDTNRR